MRIGIDTSFLLSGDKHLLSLGLNCIKLLITEDAHEFFIYGFGSDLTKSLGIVAKSNLHFINFQTSPSVSFANRWYKNRKFRKLVKTSRLDLYLSFGAQWFLPLGICKSVVITGSFEKFIFPQNSLSGSEKYFFEMCKQADFLFTPSNYCKRELVRLGFSENKIEALYAGISQTFQPEQISTEMREIRRTLIIYKVATPYIFYNGNLSQEKNIKTLLKAFALVAKRHPDLKLVLGSSEFKVGWDSKSHPLTKDAQETADQIAELKLKHKVIITGEIDEHHLPVIVASSKAFVDLSTHALLPQQVADSLAAGVPVIAASRGAYPEIIEDASLLVNPIDENEVAEALITLLGEKNAAAKFAISTKRVLSICNWQTFNEKLRDKIIEISSIVSPLRIAIIGKTLFPDKTINDLHTHELIIQLNSLGHNADFIRTDPAAEDYDNGRYTIKNTYAGFFLLRVMGVAIEIITGKFDLLITLDATFSTSLGIWLAGFFRRFAVAKHTFSDTSYTHNFIYKSYMAFLNLALFRNLFSFHLVNDSAKSDEDIEINCGITPDEVSNKQFIKEYSLSRKLIIAAIPKDGNEAKFVIDCFGKFKRTKRNIKLLLLCRNRQFIGEVENLITAAKIEKYAVAAVADNAHDMQVALSATQIFINLDNADDVGYWLISAMTMGNAIISVRTLISELLLKNKVNGLHFDQSDEKMLSNNLKLLLDDKQLIKNMSDKNIEEGKKYTWTQIIDKITKITINKLR